MSRCNASDVLSVADQIEAYLQGHPHAADTVEGIAQWWLLGLGIGASPSVIQQALDYLVLRSIVRCNVNYGGNKVYSSSKTNMED